MIKYKVIKISKTSFQNYRPKISINKIYWEFHKCDADINPSVPHGHSLDGKYKLELWSGKIYDVKNNGLFGIVKTKEIQKLYNYDDFCEFVEECRTIYRELHPDIILPPLTNNSDLKRCQKTSNIFRRKGRKKDGFIICLKFDKK